MSTEKLLIWITLSLVMSLMILAFSWTTFVRLLENRQGHFYDKGYLLCSSLIDGQDDLEYGELDIVKACIEKYAELNELE